MMWNKTWRLVASTFLVAVIIKNMTAQSNQAEELCCSGDDPVVPVPCANCTRNVYYEGSCLQLRREACPPPAPETTPGTSSNSTRIAHTSVTRRSCGCRMIMYRGRCRRLA